MAQDQQQTRYKKPTNQTDPPSKSTISSILSTFSPNSDDPPKKKYSRFRGLGCAAPAQVSVPAMIRTSANWEGKKVRKKKMKKNKNCVSDDVVVDGVVDNAPATVPVQIPASCLVVPDVWCGPGIGLSTDAASVDCVVSRRPVGSSRGKVDIDKINVREVCFLFLFKF